MALFTGKGDDGKTLLLSAEERVSKASCQTEVLGVLDEVNTLIGVCKAKSRNFTYTVNSSQLADILEDIQQDLFTIQAVTAGSPKSLNADRIEELEVVISGIEKELPPIKSFLLSGGTELSGLLDYARAVVRRAERVFVGCAGAGNIPEGILKYLNRLSSLLYALVRFVNHVQDVEEVPPSY
ncbi:MAG: cob(I)yrinic acid a,c-diamide adenosyltransferase [Candidatus Colwellbacteria bacterium]|nr:cob(I)yrinic acid a,c-diamide adenosyltransferase [Candidatus Colwellbacteria bacterium]